MDNQVTDLFANTIEPVRKSNPKDIFRIDFIAVPRSKKSECSETQFPGGVQVEVWADADSLRDAELFARKELVDMGWYPAKFMCWKLMPGQGRRDLSGKAFKFSQRDAVE